MVGVATSTAHGGDSIAVLILGQFAMAAIIPIALALRTTWRWPHLRALRPWVAGLAAAYAIPLAAWAIGPHRAPSLSKDMNPGLAGLVIAVAIAVLARTTHFGRSRRDSAAV